jgi:hypothetical protein
MSPYVKPDRFFYRQVIHFISQAKTEDQG